MSTFRAVKKVVVMGGDERNLYLINYLSDLGLDVYVVGFDRVGYQVKGKSIHSLEDNELDYEAIILPVIGLDDEGNIPSSYTNRKLNFFKETEDVYPLPLVVVGMSNEQLNSYIENKGGRLIETIHKDELAIYNSIPTAEGAVFKAIQMSKTTIHGSKALVLGLGRCGLTLARLLVNMEADVTVAARRASQLARAEELGAQSIHLSSLADNIHDFQLIFNSIPDLILTENLVRGMNSQTIIVDIASGNGGTDFDACRQNNIKAILAPGLPGEVAPKTAGEILGKVYMRLLSAYIGR